MQSLRDEKITVLNNNTQPKRQRTSIQDVGPAPGRVCIYCLEPVHQDKYSQGGNGPEAGNKMGTTGLLFSFQCYSYAGGTGLEIPRLDARDIMFYKIYHNIVAINLPSCIQKPNRQTRHMHPLCSRQIEVKSDYRKFSFFRIVLPFGIDFPLILLPCQKQEVYHWGD
jgi:hypothetical protein